MNPKTANYLYDATPEEKAQIRTHPGTTRDGKPFDWFVREKIESGQWRLECLDPEVLGLSRPLEIFRARRKGNLIKPWTRTDSARVYCPAHWADLAIGRGACGLRCRACFLVLTHRIFCDPSRHLLYENVGDYEKAVRRWLKRPNRRSLGLGIDCSDSLLYEGVTGHARRLIPLMADEATNPHGVRLILLTKSTNAGYLAGLPTRNVVLTFSLNPSSIADLWEGKFPDGVRVTPAIEKRLEASRLGEERGFEVRWRVDPIFQVDTWQDVYRDFFRSAARQGHRPSRITLGTYRETQRALGTFVRGWGLPAPEWQPQGLVKDGDHYHLPAEARARIYGFLASTIRQSWRPYGHEPIVALCKEPHAVRAAVGLDHDQCNCG